MDALMVDAEALCYEILGASDDLAALVGGRVYSMVPALNNGADEWRFPLIRYTRVAGTPMTNRPLYADRPRIQLDAYAGPKRTALTVLETARQVLAAAVDTAWDTGVLTAVRFGPLSWQPEPEFTPAPSRYRCDVTLTTHPHRP